VPPVAWKPFLGLVSEVYDLCSDSSHLMNNRRLKGVGFGRKAFLIATGPSLKDEDLSFLADYDCFSVSNFILHPQLNTVSPRIHFFAPYHEPLILNNFIQWLKRADDMLPHDTSVCISERDKPLIEKYSLFRGRDLIYLRLGKAPSYGTFELTKTVLAPYTSPIMALPVLLYMGYSSVYLLGCDNNSLRNFGGTIENFYDSQLDPRLNATSDEKWTSGIIVTIEEQLEQFKQYEFYNRLFKRLGRNLFQCSPSSWLTFVNFASLTSQNQGKALGKTTDL